MPGPLSSTTTTKRSSVPDLADLDEDLEGCGPLAGVSALSTASFTQVRRALRGLSKPRRWRFLVKNSETEISRCLDAMLWAVSGPFGFFAIYAAIALRRATRSSMGGCVEKRPAIPRIESGFKMKRWAVASARPCQGLLGA